MRVSGVTRTELEAVEPGMCIRRRRGNRRIRVVLAVGHSRYGGLSVVGLVKIGRSWTDPNPSAWIDAAVVLRDYAVTGRRGLSLRSARRLLNWRRQP